VTARSHHTLLAAGLLAGFSVAPSARADQALNPADSAASELLLRDEAAVAAPGLLDRLLGAGVGTSLRRRVTSPSTAAPRVGMEALSLTPLQPGLALLCDRGGAGALGLHQQCMLARLELDGSRLPGYGRGAGLNGAWFIDRAGLDLSFGLSWLSVEQPQRFDSARGNLIGLPGLMDLSPLQITVPGVTLQARVAQLGGTLDIGENGWLRLEAQSLRGDQPATSLWAQPLPVIDSDALRLSAGAGAFSGALTGRIIELQGSPGLLNSLDLGVSWRTPWRGELTVGATQYWNRGNTSDWPLRELPPAVEESSARVPYVRYHQDL
jgi:hypothetical protein